MFILEASVYGWCIGVQIGMKMTLFLGHGAQAKWQTPSSYRPIALLPSYIGSNPLAKQHISFVAPTTRHGMVLPTMPQSLLDLTEKAKGKMLGVTMDMCGGRGGELG